MALKRKITEAEYNALNDVLKAEYKANGGSYVLDTDDAQELINARDLEKREKEAAKTELKTLKAELEEIKKNGGDFEAIEKSYKQKIATLEGTVAELNTTLTGERRDRYANAEAAKIAAKFTVPALMQKEIAKRLDIDPKDPTKVRVLDADGKPSAATIADLEKEFVDNPEYKGIVIASKATGSAGSPPNKQASGSPILPNTQQNERPIFAKMTPAELAAHMAAKKEAEQGNNT
jgi:hypothetical protein